MEKNMNNQNEQQGLEERASHTPSELNAYNALPELMQMRVCRNKIFRYDLYIFYYPDMLFEDSKVVIKIDGGYHKDRVDYDRIRDERFKERGYVVLRFKNEETKDKVEFLQKLLSKFLQIEDRKERYGLSTYIRSIQWHLQSIYK